jgi:hypothetical protein
MSQQMVDFQQEIKYNNGRYNKRRLLDMPTIKDALDIIGKLTPAEQESLKTML